MPVVSHLVAEQEPHAEVVHVCVSHADVEHEDEVVGFLAASHLEASAAPPLDVLQSTVRVSVPVEPQVDVEQADQDEEYQLYLSHDCVEHDDVAVGFVAALHLDASTLAPLVVLQSTVRVWMPVEPQVDTEQAPHDNEACQLYVSHAGVEHDAVAAGFLAASHLEASAAAPLAVLQSTVRVSVPVAPQVDVEHADQEEECHVG